MLAPRRSPFVRPATIVSILAAASLSLATPPASSPAAAQASVVLPPLTPAASPRASAAPDAEQEDALSPEPRREADFFRHLAGGDLDAERVRRMWAESRAVPSEAPARAELLNTWQLAGPVFSTSPGGSFKTGRVRDIDPVNIRALAASGGLWKFDIFGGIPMCDSVPASWFGSFATRPTDPNTILLGTGEYRMGAGTGLYKTTDGGATWRPILLIPQPQWFSRLRWSSTGTTAYAASDLGFYRSVDGGESWRNALAGDVSDFSVVAGVPGLIFATIADRGVWTSTDDGVTWTQLQSNGVPNGVPGIGAVSAVNFPLGGGVWIYVAFDKRIWRSTTGGGSWTEVTPSFNFGNSGYGPVLSANPIDPQTVLYGNVPFLRSTTAGGSWDKILTGDLHADYHMFAWDSDNNGVWAAHDGGWSHSLDKGVTWSSSSNAMPITQFYSIDCEKTDVGMMVGGTQDNNVLYTPSPSLAWVNPAVGATEGDSPGAVIDLYNPQQMWAVSGVSAAPISFPIYHTSDGGTTWNESDAGMAGATGGSIRTDNVFPARLVTSTGTLVYESLDAASTWTQSNPVPFPNKVTSLTSSTRVAGGAVLYATIAGTTVGQRLFVRDNGAWVERDAGLPPGYVIKVVPHPWAAYADEAWAIVSGGAGQRFFFTNDRGLTWTNVTGDFPSSMPVSDLVPNPRHVGELYVGSLLGCFRSKNGGVNWEHWNNGMPPAAIISSMSYIDLTTTTGQFFVVAATYGRSVWKRDVSGEDVFPTLLVSSPSVQEGDAGTRTAWFRVALSSPQPNDVTVDYATQDSSATTADNDYVPASGTLTFLPNQTVAWVPVSVNGDTRIEGDETFKLGLSNPLRALVGDPGVCTIQDDDAHGLVCSDLPVTDGAIQAMALAGSTLYVGGSFQKVGAATGCAAPLDATSGLPSSLPKVDGNVNAVAPDGSGGWYLGGVFRHVGGVPRTNLAHVLADGSLAPWNPAANDFVFAIVPNGSTVYVAGRFTTIDGVPDAYLAAVDATTGLPLPWSANANDQVLALALTGTTLYVGGSFTSIGGEPRDDIAALNTTTGWALDWNPGADGPVSSIVFDGGPLYVAGSFTHIGGRARNSVAALDLGAGGATDWNPNPDSYVFTLASDATFLYAGGVFANIDGQPRANLAQLDRSLGHTTSWAPNPDGAVLALARGGSTLYVGGTYANIGGQGRDNLAAVSVATGLATAWNPDPNNTVAAIGLSGGSVFAGGYFTSLGGQPRRSLAAFDVPSGRLLHWNPGADGAVSALLANGGLVYAGGSFDTIGGQPRNRIAALDGVTGQPTGWDPNANSSVRTLLLFGSRLYAGGSFTTIGGITRNRIAAISTTTGAPIPTWNANANGTVNALATDGTLLYAGGSFGTIGNQTRNGLAALSGVSGAALPTWNPSPNAPTTMLLVSGTALFVGGSFTQITGLPRPRLAAIDLSTSTVATWTPAPNGVVNTLVPFGPEVYVGGAFTAIGGVPRQHLALLRPATNQVSSWAPDPDGNVSALALVGSTIYAGGAFTSIGGESQAHLGCLIPTDLVDVPPATAGALLTLRLSPNPAWSRVRIDYTLPEAAHASIAVYDVQGRRVGAAFDARQGAGAHSMTWDRASAPGVRAGIYFVRITAGARTLVRRLALL